MIKVPLGITIGITAAAACVTFILTNRYALDTFNEKLSDVNEKQQVYSYISEVDVYSRASYIGEIDDLSIKQGMIKGYVEGIGDPFCAYMTADEYAAYTTVPEGMVEGLGFTYTKDKSGYIRVTGIEQGGAAEDSGVLEGDIITAVNNTDVIAFEGGYDEAVLLFNATEGTRVKLYVKRVDEYGTNFIDYDVIGKVSEHITVTDMRIDNVGLIRIKEITQQTEHQFKNSLDKLIQKGVKGIVIDVRDLNFNDLGVLQSLLDHVIGSGDILTATEKNGTQTTLVTCTEAENISMPLAVLVNENTEYCAEFFAQSLKDYAGAVIVGSPTKGHTTYQKPMTMVDDSVLLISAANVSTGKTAISGKIAPDENVPFPEDIKLSDLRDIDIQVYDTQFIRAAEVVSE